MVQLLLEQNGKYEKADGIDLAVIKNKRAWLQLIAPAESEIRYITDNFSVPEDFIRSALDDEERARIDDDDDTGYSLVVFDIPVTEDEKPESDAPYTTLPLAVIKKDDNLVITVCLSDNSIFHDIQIGKEKKNILLESDKLIYQLLLAFHTQYVKYLRLVDKTSSRIESQLSNYTNTQEILKLMKLKNALIYFASSLRNNILIVKQLLVLAKGKDDDIETLENIKVEVEQAFDTCNLQRELMTESMGAYSNIMSNRLADKMRILTIITIILAIPTLVAGLWGMNTKLPFAEMDSYSGFFIIMGLIFMTCALTLYFVMQTKPQPQVLPKPKRRKRKKKLIIKNHNEK
ncbi:MAG: magnesium transporter CorA family protein [Christensenellaceae bacterium]|jgi:magnesium transporter|nr:magnesium transporter CorA family protein [Christensenellaceae bacterium]